MAGRAQQRIKRTLAKGVPFVSGGQYTLNLPRNYDYETIFVSMRGSYTSPAAFGAGSNGFSPALRTDSPFGLIPRVEVIIEGRQTIVNVPARMLGMSNVWRRRLPWYITNVDSFSDQQRTAVTRNAATATSVIAVATSYNFACTFAIDFQLLKGLRPKDSNVRSGGMQTFDLRLTFGDVSALFYQPSSTLLTTPFSAPAGGATLAATTAANLGTINATTINIYDTELEEIAGKDKSLSTPGFVQRWTNQNIAIPAANANLELQLPTDNFIGAILISPTIGNEASDLVLNAVTARRGTDVRFNLAANDLGVMTERDYEHPRFPGYYVLDFMNSGAPSIKIADAWNVQGGADTRLSLDVGAASATTAVDVTTVELMPLGQ